ncbi:MAG: nucleotidyltransferase [Bacteroidia bacterium]|nr:nucleotidyltransferase [Bacteroidia bacterium]
MSDSNVFSPDFKEFVELLNRHEVNYMVTGGYAVGVYGYPRYTGDIDFWVSASLENGNRLVQVFEDFGLKSFGLTPEDFAKPEQVIQIGYPPFRIDVLTSIDGVDFVDAYPNRSTFEIDGISVNFIGLEDLKINKKASGRGKDIEDLKNLGE